jgi:hypothetical protein
MGRRKIAVTQRRKMIVSTGLTAKEYAHVVACARKARRSMADYIRQEVLAGYGDTEGA